MNESYARTRIMVADDDPAFGDALLNMIRDRFACPVRLVRDGDTAARVLETEPFDIVIVNMQIPGAHGLEFVEDLKKRWPEIDVIAITGRANPCPYIELVGAGVSDFVSKPFPLEELEAKVMRVLETRRQRRSLICGRERILRRVKAVEDTASNGERGNIKYRAIFELNMMPTLVLDAETLCLRAANKAFCDLCGRQCEALLHRDFRELLNGPSRVRLEQVFAAVSRMGRGTLSDMCIETSNGNPAIVDLGITFIGDGDERFVHVACKDLTEQKALQQELVERAARDGLTGLYNQRALRVRLETAIRNAQANSQPLSVLSIDLDDFKQCNDRYGHPVGDSVLRSAGQAILEQIRSLDAGFRNGGDEFCVLVRSANAAIGQTVAERIRVAFEKSECYGTSMSIGIAEYRNSMDGNALMKAADDALYKAKSSGKNAICVA
ncbi:MAG TPA: diguanylate cyclase [Candidatus Hydrogenedentes bacterium]|nr:diguanylate cyclase [Candidatus Hydrogenedentota bacterium]